MKNNRIIIDIHSHPHYDNRKDLQITKKLKENRLPYIEERNGNLFLVSARDDINRPVEDDLTDPKVMREKKNKFGITKQLKLSSPWVFRYELKEKELAVWIAQLTNDKIIEEWVSPYPDDFIGGCTVPMQFVPEAIKELERCYAMGFRVVTIGTTVNQIPLYHEMFDPFWARTSELGMFPFIHPQEMDEDPESWLQWLEEMLHRTARAMNAFMLLGILDRFPDLRPIFSHGGTAWFTSGGRKSYGFKVREDLVKKDPFRHVEKIYADTHTCDIDLLIFLIKKFGAERFLYGADSPFALGDWPSKNNPNQIPGQSIYLAQFGNNATEDENITNMLLHGNAEKLLRTVA